MATHTAIARALDLLDTNQGPSVVIEDGHGGLEVTILRHGQPTGWSIDAGGVLEPGPDGRILT